MTGDFYTGWILLFHLVQNSPLRSVIARIAGQTRKRLDARGVDAPAYQRRLAQSTERAVRRLPGTSSALVRHGRTALESRPSLAIPHRALVTPRLGPWREQGKFRVSRRGRQGPALAQLHEKMAGSTGFEPATSGLTAHCHLESMRHYGSPIDGIQGLSDHPVPTFTPIVSLSAR